MATESITSKLQLPPDFKDKELMIKSVDDLMTVVRKYIKSEEDNEKILAAAKYAMEKFRDVKRKNGEPYHYHLLTAAYYVAKWQCDPKVIIAALLHDLIEDIEGETKETVSKMFGDEVSYLVDKMTKIRLFEKSQTDLLGSYMRKILLGMAKDVRVMVIKMADRLNNIETLYYLREEKQIRYAKETMVTYVPIARALGFNEWVRHISNLCFWYIDKKKYYAIYQEVERLKKDSKIIDTSIRTIKGCLYKNDVKPLKVYGREKAIVSIDKKIEQKENDLNDVHDIFALRIICNNINDCYASLGSIHQEFNIVKDRFKDYIASPKGNMYQSLHTTVMIGEHKVEVQIRTEEMHAIAEDGIAAHWKYKENQEFSAKEQQKEIMNKIHILRNIIKYDESAQDTETTSDGEWWKNLQEEILNETIVCLTPNKKAIEMKKGASVLDFAFHIHTEVGLNAIRGVVNKESKPLKTILEAGDIVEIVTQNRRNFSIKWLSYVATTTARNKLKKALKQEEATTQKDLEKQKIESGFNALKNYLEGTRMWNVYLKNKDDIEQFLIEKEGVQSINQVYINLSGSRKILNPLFSYMFTNLLKREEQLEYAKLKQSKQKVKEEEIIIDGIEGLKVELAKCCNPIYGDKIVALVSRRSGLKVHKENCKNVLDVSPYNDTFDANWGRQGTKAYKAKLIVEALNHDKMIDNLLGAFGAMNIGIENLHTKFLGNSRLLSTVEFKITSTIELELLIKSIREIKDVLNVDRSFF